MSTGTAWNCEIDGHDLQPATALESLYCPRCGKYFNQGGSPKDIPRKMISPIKAIPSLPDEKYLLTPEEIDFIEAELNYKGKGGLGTFIDALLKAQLSKLLEHLPELAREHGYVKK